MLYITTRNHQDIQTSFRTLTKDRGSCGGLYIPFQLFRFSQGEISAFVEKTFSECVADILNSFFSARLDKSDIECCMGTHPLKLIPMSHKITVAEIWNNPAWSFSRFVRNLNGRILGNADIGSPCNWMWVAARIAVLFGVFAELTRSGLLKTGQHIDISVCAGDFSAPVAVWYAREMGLPIGTIVFSCNENSSAWELLHHGEMRCNDAVVSTLTPACDFAMPYDIERLIYATLGEEEALRFVRKLSSKSIYTLTEDERKKLSSGFFGAVIGKKRTGSIIRNVYRTCAYLLGPYSALAYGGLQDYRATNGETNAALILTEDGPLRDAETVAGVLGITKESLLERVHTV